MTVLASERDLVPSRWRAPDRHRGRGILRVLAEGLRRAKVSRWPAMVRICRSTVTSRRRSRRSTVRPRLPIGASQSRAPQLCPVGGDRPRCHPPGKHADGHRLAARWLEGGNEPTAPLSRFNEADALALRRCLNRNRRSSAASRVLVSGWAPRIAGHLAHLDCVDAHGPAGPRVSIRHDRVARLAVLGDFAGPQGATDPPAVDPDVDGGGRDSAHSCQLSRDGRDVA